MAGGRLPAPSVRRDARGGAMQLAGTPSRISVGMSLLGHGAHKDDIVRIQAEPYDLRIGRKMSDSYGINGEIRAGKALANVKPIPADMVMLAKVAFTFQWIDDCGIFIRWLMPHGRQNNGNTARAQHAP